MAPVEERPFFFYEFELLRASGIKRFLFLTGYGAQSIEDFFGDGRSWDAEIRYMRDGDRVLGTGGALRHALPFLEPRFFLLYGDSYMDLDYEEMACRFSEAANSGARVLMAVLANGGSLGANNVRLENGDRLRYDKFGPSSGMTHIDYGVAVFDRNVVGEIPEGTSDLADTLKRVSSRGEIVAYEAERRFYEIGTPESLLAFARHIQALRTPKKAVFLDRDGTLNRLVPDPVSGALDSPLTKDAIVLVPRAAAALGILRELGYLLIVVTNQPAAAKGKTTLGKLYAVNRELHRLLKECGVVLDAILMCPHHPTGSTLALEQFLIRDCGCRKPKAGLLLDALAKHKIDAAGSFMVGDRDSDVSAGRAAGVKTVFLRPRTRESGIHDSQEPDSVSTDLYEFANALKEKNHASGA